MSKEIRAKRAENGRTQDFLDEGGRLPWGDMNLRGVRYPHTPMLGNPE